MTAIKLTENAVYLASCRETVKCINDLFLERYLFLPITLPASLCYIYL